jgi:hypothetical protein
MACGPYQWLVDKTGSGHVRGLRRRLASLVSLSSEGDEEEAEIRAVLALDSCLRSTATECDRQLRVEQLLVTEETQGVVGHP